MSTLISLLERLLGLRLLLPLEKSATPVVESGLAFVVNITIRRYS